VFTFEEAIHRMSGMTAEILGLSNRGVPAKGRRADILIIDPQRIKDTATYEEPFSKAQGIELVVVNGKIVKSGDNDFPIAAGRVLNLNRAES
jgi:N-acyl-D-aspartate/D-glutamate deacylase